MGIYNELSDADLVSLLKAGDHLAYTEIFRRYYHLMYVHAYKKLRDEEEAKDVIQELFATLWTKRETDFITTNLAGYLYTSVRNRILDLFAHQQVESKYMLSLKDFIETDGNNTTDYRIREKELIAYIDKEIQALPPKMREVFELSRKSNLSHREIAELLNLSEQTVSKQVTNALKVLRSKLGLFICLYYMINS